LVVHPLQEGMGQKGQDDEAGQEGRSMLLAVTGVVLEGVAFRFQGVVVFILDLPATAPGLDDFDHPLLIEPEGGGEGIAIQHPAGRVGGGERTPVDQECVVGIPEGNVVDEAIRVNFMPLAGPAPAGQGHDSPRALDVFHPLLGGGMGHRLADPDDVEPMGLRGPDKGLVAIQVVAQNDHLQPPQLRTLHVQPALGGVEFAVLLLGSLLGPDEFGRQRNDFVTPRLDHDRGQGGMKVRHRPMAVPACRTVLAVDDLR